MHPSSDPRELARAIRDSLGLRELYVADLDAISGEPSAKALHRDLAELDLRLWIDAGVQTMDDLAPLLGLDATSVVVGLETVCGPEALEQILDQAGADRTILSLDLFEGVPRLAPGADWSAADPAGLARQALELGARRLILLDLSRVGTGRGIGTHDLLAWLRRSDPDIEVTVGGGITGIDEVRHLRDQGAAAVLIGSALHDGRIGREQISSLGG